MFTLTHDLLVRLCALNRFPVPTGEMAFAGLRGTRQKNPLDNGFAAGLDIDVVDVDYHRPHCTLVQWRPGDRQVAAFPGSTVPHADAIDPTKSGTFNQIFTGFYSGAFARGNHPRAAKDSQHAAFVENREFMILRTSDDTIFDAASDAASSAFPGDNLHSGWCQLDVPASHYASVGCQVVVGYPDTISGSRKAGGPWKTFKENGYRGSQTVFDYLLLPGRDVATVAAGGTGASRRLRFGSQGGEVTALQSALVKTGDFIGRPDTDFGPQSLLALLAFQKHAGQDVDGVAGPAVFEALGLPA